MHAKLRAKQLRFVDEYMIDLNSAQACLRAGYKTKNSDVLGPQILAKPAVAAEIAARQAKLRDKLRITAERVLTERARIAFFDPRKLFREDGSPKPIVELDDDAAAVVAGLDVASAGNAEIGVGQILKIKLADKNAALTALEKHLGLHEKADDAAKPLNIVLHLGD